ncbi:hypothetical protein CAC42_6305 [Sphaceloma murrayae]|uniref:Uncharacterized protein n=1 Tax=Sphaceloma murrayae TaxID=2082308 RepID=A0A2K1QTU8_9PEZI|nr:hypothetical protein CAC42_6305 [Sphaceloma murrayae]
MASSVPVTSTKAATLAHGFLSLAPETSIPAVVSMSSSPSLIPTDSSDSLSISVKNKRSPSTDSVSSSASSNSAARRFLRLGHVQSGDGIVVRSDFVDVDE